jgi:hypothetical protein
MLTELFLILILLQIKHWYIDFVNQSNEEVEFKGTYLDWRGIKHSLKQGLGTAVCLWIFVGIPLAVVLGFIDFLIHYHIDWAKMNINKKHGYTVQDPKFWTWLGADQMAHQVTYIFLVWVLFI